MGIADRFLDKSDSSKDDAVAFATQTADAMKNQRSLLDVAWESCKYQMLQAPAQGIGQLIDRGCGTNLQKDWTFMEKPKEAHSFAEWHAQQLGGAVGMVAPFAVMNLGLHVGADKVLGATTTGLKRAIAESALSGAVYEGVFTPSADNESIGWGRLKNAVHGATTFGILGGAAKGLYDSGLVTNRILNGVVSGIPAGAWSTQLESIMQGRGPASMQETGRGMYGFAIGGGFLNAIHAIPLAERVPGKAEYTIANEESRAALDSFRRGERQTAWADVFKNGEPQRLFVAHEGADLSFKLGPRPDLVALCQLPSMSAWASRLALRGATEKPIFMDLTRGGDNVRFSTRQLSPEAVALGPKENVAAFRKMMDGNGINPESVPSWLGQFKPTGQSWRGNNSLVIELANRAGNADVVLKIKEADMEPSRWFEADIYNARGEVNPRAVHETVDAHTDSPLYIFLESKHDFNPRDWTGYDEFMAKLEEKGIQLEPGSGPPVGKDMNTGRWSVTDRDSASSYGSGVHDVERAAAMGREGFDDYMAKEEEKAGADNWESQEGMGAFDVSDVIELKGKMDGLRFTPAEQTTAAKLFKGDATKQVQVLLEQMTDGMSSKADIEIMQTWAVNDGNATLSKQQIKFAQEVARARKLRLNF